MLQCLVLINYQKALNKKSIFISSSNLLFYNNGHVVMTTNNTCVQAIFLTDTLVKIAAMLPNCFKPETSYHSKLCVKKKLKKQYLMSSETNNATKPWKTSIHNKRRSYCEVPALFLQNTWLALEYNFKHPTASSITWRKIWTEKPTAMPSPSQYIRDRKILRSHDHDDESDGKLTICVNILCH